LSILRLANSGLTVGVDIKQIRRANMLALIGEKKGAKAAFARKVDTDPAYVSQILSTRTKADVGNELARAIETAYGLPYGWMDHEHRTAKDAYQDSVAEFEWVYNHVSDEGKVFLKASIDAAKAAYIGDKGQAQKEA
jgi:hypothetical protein